MCARSRLLYSFLLLSGQKLLLVTRGRRPGSKWQKRGSNINEGGKEVKKEVEERKGGMEEGEKKSDKEAQGELQVRHADATWMAHM